MNTEEQLSQWARSWALINGTVFCTECKASQPVTAADDEFKHAEGCKASMHVDAYPWVVLHNVLDRERG